MYVIFAPSDVDGVPDVDDLCPADPLDLCNPGGSTAGEIDSETGGTVETPDGGLALDIEPGDLPGDATISVTQTAPTDPEVDLTVGPNPGLGKAIAVYDLEPEGLQFDSPVTLTLVADVSALNANQRERVTIYLFTDTDADEVPDTFVEVPGTVCNVNEDSPGTFIATCTAELDHFSIYALIAPLDTDNDGVPDQFDEVTDVCPGEPNVVEGFFSPLTTLVLESAPDVPVAAKAFKQGSTVPLKLAFLCGDTPLTDATPPEIVALARSGGALNIEVIDLDSGLSNDNGTLFRLAGNTWVFNLGTGDLVSGTYVITIRVPDGRLFNGAFVLR